MRISVGIFLVAAGGIIAFAIRDTSGPVNFTVVGVVIMLAGVAGLLLSYLMANRGPRDQDPVAMKPAVEDQYRTEPHEYPLEHQMIDVTPTEYQHEPRPQRPAEPR